MTPVSLEAMLFVFEPQCFGAFEPRRVGGRFSRPLYSYCAIKQQQLFAACCHRAARSSKRRAPRARGPWRRPWEWPRRWPAPGATQVGFLDDRAYVLDISGFVADTSSSALVVKCPYLRTSDARLPGCPLMGPVRAANLRTKILDFGGFDSSRILILRGWNSQGHREFPGKLESSDLSRDDLSREIGRTWIHLGASVTSMGTPQTVHRTLDVLSSRHRLNEYLAQGVPSLFLASSFRMCLTRGVLPGMFPWRTRYLLS